jgi:hypothetical protein
MPTWASVGACKTKTARRSFAILNQILAACIIKKLLADGEGTPRQRDFGDPIFLDPVEIGVEIVQDMFDIGWGANGGNGLDLGDVAACRQHCCAAQRMAHQQRGSLMILAQPISGGDKIGDVGGEAGVGEVTLRSAQPGEVKPEHAKPCAANSEDTRLAALVSLEQVKQWAKMAKARAGPPDGMSSRAASWLPCAPVNVTLPDEAVIAAGCAMGRILAVAARTAGSGRVNPCGR